MPTGGGAKNKILFCSNKNFHKAKMFSPKKRMN